jgi:hypothetical protein
MRSEKIEKIVDLAATLASKADDIDQVLVIYRLKEGVEDATHGSLDNDLELRDSLWLVKAFEFWLQASALGLLKKKDDD